MSGTGETVTAAQSAGSMEQLKKRIEEEIKAKSDLRNLSRQVEITITSEGLRIELLEDKNGTFYEMGSARLSRSGQELLALIAGELKILPNALLIEGHTDAAQYSNDASYGNWELSADRANSARRLMQQDGVRADQVTQVRGYADQMLRVKASPYDPSNRRISILVKNEGEGAPELRPLKAATKEMPSAVNAVDAANPGARAAPAQPPAAAKTVAPVNAHPGLMGRIRAMISFKAK